MKTKRMYMTQPIVSSTTQADAPRVFVCRRGAVDNAVEFVEHDRYRMNADTKASIRAWLEEPEDRGFMISASWHDGRSEQWRFAVVRPVDVEVE